MADAFWLAHVEAGRPCGPATTDGLSSDRRPGFARSWRGAWPRLGGIALLALAAIGSRPARAVVPPPAETPANIVTSGRTSTAVDIKVVKVGQEIPKTFAGARMANTPGYAWYVSEHYALKSSMGDDFSRMMLEVSELAHPHWVEMTGLAPPDPETTRMCIVYGKSRNDMNTAVLADLGWTYNHGGGGVTFPHNNTAYNFPSGSLQYHMKDLVIHENLHMLQAVSGDDRMGTENFTFAGAQHVFSAANKRLTVECFDRAPVNNWTDLGLAEVRKQFVPLRTLLEKHWHSGGGLGALHSFFFWSDPDRYLKWKIWRDEFYADRVTNDTNVAFMEDIFGPLDELDAAWERWVKERRASFHYISWGWEQDGDALMAYGYDPKAWSQMDLPYPPGETVRYDPLRMDYPAEPMPPIVGPVERGVEEPTVGFVADLSGGGWVGFGLGVVDRGMCHVVIDSGHKLVVEGKDLPIARQEFPLTDEVRTAGERSGKRYGVTVQIRRNELAVTVRSSPTNRMDVNVPLEPAVRERLMSRPLSLIANGGQPKITPFIDDARRPEPDLSVPAAANRWRFAGLDRLETLYRAAWRLKGRAPGSLLALKREMLAAVTGNAATQAAAVAAYESRIDAVARDVRGCGADPRTIAAALADLAGVFMTFDALPDASGGMASLTARINSRLDGEAAGTLTLAVGADAARRVVTTRPLGRLTRSVRIVTEQADAAGTGRELPCSAVAELTWRGESFTLEREQTLVDTCIPVWWTIGPFDNRGGGHVDTPQPVEREAVDLEKTHAGARGQDVAWRKFERPESAGRFGDCMMDLAERYGNAANVSVYACTWIESPREQDAILAVGSDDGMVAWLNGERVHAVLWNRGYAPKTDRVPIRLRAGRNELLVKVMQGGGGWSLGAHLLDKDGKFLRDVEFR